MAVKTEKLMAAKMAEKKGYHLVVVKVDLSAAVRADQKDMMRVVVLVALMVDSMAAAMVGQMAEKMVEYWAEQKAEMWVGKSVVSKVVEKDD